MRTATLEAFLRSRGRRWVAVGETRITDNIAAAALYIVGLALDAYPAKPQGLTVPQHQVLARITCAVSHGLASLIEESGSWRVAALVSAARLLAPYTGLNGAAQIAASARRDYSAELRSFSPDIGLLQIRHEAVRAVAGIGEAHTARVAQLIAQRLATLATYPVVEKSHVALCYDLGGATFKSPAGATPAL